MPCSYCGAPKTIARGLCSNCYQRQRNRGTLEPKYMPRIGICSVEGCGEKVEAKGFCRRHYNLSRHPMTNSWKLLRARYPGQFPPSWARFEAYLADVGERPTPKHQLRRKDPREPWSLDNIEWVPPVGQSKTGSMTAAERSAYGREWKIQRHYGINGEQFAEMERKQNGVCAICELPPKDGKFLAVDHDHQTGAVRGLLCISCNRGIGYLADDPQRLRKALAYLGG